MKRFWISLCLFASVLGVVLAPVDADARRLGGGSSSGMKRTVPQQPPPQQPAQGAQQPTQNAAAAPAAGAQAAAAAPRRSWMGPIAGLAAGLGLAALFSHLGWGAGAANIVMLLLLGLAAAFAVRWVMKRMAGGSAASLRPAYAGGGNAKPDSKPDWMRVAMPPAASPAAAAPVGAAPAAAEPLALPPSFDRAAFERIAKQMFVRLQAANDRGDLDDLRRFTTPEMFAAARVDLLERQGKAQQTDVVELEAQVVDLASEAEQDVVSVRYRGLVREEADAPAQPFDEVWHLVRPREGQGDWLIAGIQQIA
jgi:predicted lipid-binding transport protein (Tim44 family)